MKFKTLLFVILIAGILNTSCKSGKEKQIASIKAAEKEMVTDQKGAFDKKKADELVKQYVNFAGQYKDDTLAPVYLMKAAELQMSLAQPQPAIDIINRIIKEYPQFRKTPDCYFLKAFIYENNMNDMTAARDAYIDFLKRFPTHVFAKDAKALLMNLGKSPDELIKEFEAQNQGKE